MHAAVPAAVASTDRALWFSAKQFDHPQMRSQMYVNMATVMATNGEFEKAERFAQQALVAKPADQAALLLYIYLQLQRGDKEGALSTLKDHRTAPHNPNQ